MPEPLTRKDFEKAMKSLDSTDPIDVTSTTATILGGGILGTGAAAATGISTGGLLGFFGIYTFDLPALPMLVAGGIVGAALFYGLSRLNRSNGRIAHIRELRKADLKEKLARYETDAAKADKKKYRAHVTDAVLTALIQEKISKQDANDMIALLNDGVTEPETVMDALRHLVG